MTVTRIAGAFLLLTVLGTLLLAFMASERGNMPLCWFLALLFQQIDIALKNQWFRQNRNFLSVSLTY